MEHVMDHEATVRAMLGAAGLAIPDDEVERLARLYPGLRQSVDRYYDVPVGDEVTASLFRAVDPGRTDSAGGDRR